MSGLLRILLDFPFKGADTVAGSRCNESQVVERCRDSGRTGSKRGVSGRNRFQTSLGLPVGAPQGADHDWPENQKHNHLWNDAANWSGCETQNRETEKSLEPARLHQSQLPESLFMLLVPKKEKKTLLDLTVTSPLTSRLKPKFSGNTRKNKFGIWESKGRRWLVVPPCRECGRGALERENRSYFSICLRFQPFPSSWTSNTD